MGKSLKSVIKNKLSLVLKILVTQAENKLSSFKIFTSNIERETNYRKYIQYTPRPKIENNIFEEFDDLRPVIPNEFSPVMDSCCESLDLIKNESSVIEFENVLKAPVTRKSQKMISILLEENFENIRKIVDFGSSGKLLKKKNLRSAKVNDNNKINKRVRTLVKNLMKNLKTVAVHRLKI